MDLCFFTTSLILPLSFLAFFYDAAAATNTECIHVHRKAIECVQKPNFILEGDVEVAKKYCHDNSWHRAVDCLQDLMDACEGDYVEGPKLRKYINVDNTRKSVNYLCENLGAFDQHSGCIKEGHKDISVCTDNEKKRYDKQQNTKELNQMENVCLFTKIAFGCLERVLEQRCGPEANNFLYNVMTGLVPTACQEMRSTSDAASHYHHHHNLSSGWTIIVLTSLASVLLSVAGQS